MLDYPKRENKYCSNCKNAEHRSKSIHVCNLGKYEFTECVNTYRSKWVSEIEEEFISEKEMLLC